ncbi:MAG: VCBS repeat-containing protein [Bacteroidia bacterium]
MNRPFSLITIFLWGTCLLLSCADGSANAPEAEGPLFQTLSVEQSGINFINKLQEDDKVNFFTYEYLYNGGGVAVGDVNQDGLPDLYFTGNMVANRLYLNRGNLQFEDVTAKAKATYLNDWCTGASMIDINADGLLDIYICASGWYEGAEKDTRRNILFVNQGVDDEGIPSFVDEAGKYGLDDPAYSTQVSYLDYDRDGDLDLYMANHPREFKEYVGDFIKKKANPPADNRDKLYRNDNGKFVDISDQAGIINYGHALGVVSLDYDRDGWQDIYVSNDYQENDFLYRNQGDGTFVNVLDEVTRHTSKFSMGVDASDYNNDGWTDILTVEMLAADNKRQKTNMASMNPALYWKKVDSGCGYQYMHNSLQLNRGNGHFSEIAYLAGVASTDWSWAPLFADFDNDGWKDLFISNGYRKDVLDKDFKKELKTKLNSEKVTYADLEPTIPSSKQRNFLFQNQKDLTFAQRKDWGLDEEINTNGAVYADLDLDGDLDLVLNHMEDTAKIYRNMSREQALGNYFQIELNGSAQNPQGISAKVEIQTPDGAKQYQEANNVRGYQSSVEPIIHFGLGQNTTISKLLITWPDQKTQTLQNLEGNQRLTLRYSEAVNASQVEDTHAANALFHKMDLPEIIHQETVYDDYAKQVLLPHKLSEEGPSMAVGDVNNDGLQDVYLGGSAGFEAQLLLQKSSGFEKVTVPAFKADKAHEDQDALWLDVEGDGDLDLYVVSGSYQFESNDPLLQDRLYLNDGKGNLSASKTALPNILSSGSCVEGADFDGDGDMDLFVGGRLTHAQYPKPGRSYLLRNDAGRFTEVTDQLIPELSNLGMVTAASWNDYDQDGQLDLIVSGEWMPITVLRNDGPSFSNQTESLGLANTTGWWNCIRPADLDNDGDIDFVLGNLGLNSKNQSSQEYPFEVYAEDLDKSGSYDIVLGYYQEGIKYPVRGLQCSSEQIPELAEKIENYDLFGSSDLASIYGDLGLQQALHYQAYEFASVWLENKDGQLILHRLPKIAQVAPTNDVSIEDVNGDQCPDIILVGNQYPVEVETGRYDAHQGLVLLGDCQGNFSPLPSLPSGFYVDGDVRAVERIEIGSSGKTGLIVGRNRKSYYIFTTSN